MNQKYKVSLVACARWESSSVQEWVIYNLNMGFDHIYLYCNDDDPRELYQALLPFLSGPNPCITFQFYGVQGQQSQMYIHFLENFLEETDWFAFFDLDEFLVLRNHETVLSLIENEVPSADAVHFWMVAAGHNYHKTRPTGPILEHFTRRADKVSPFTKCIAKSGAVVQEKIRQNIASGFFHNIAAILKDDACIVDSLGRDMKNYYVEQEESWNKRADSPNFHEEVLSHSFLYHVFMRSEEDLMRRYNRGTGGQFYGQSMWRELYEKQESIDSYMSHYNKVDEFGAYKVWQRIVSRANEKTVIGFVPPTALSTNKRATQSSTCAWSRSSDPAEDAANVVNGKFNGMPNHHTDTENGAWWQVDLDQNIDIRKIMIFNRVDNMRGRFRNFILSGSADGDHWVEFYRKADNVEFGGLDGTPFIFLSDPPVQFRFVRITGIGMGPIDVSQVMIF